MAYSREVYAAAETRINERRRAADQKNVAFKNRLYARIPRLGKIERELAETGIGVAKELIANPAGSAANIEKLKNRNLSLQAERAELLCANGFRPDALEVRYFCPDCQDTGMSSGRLCHCFKALLREEACRLANLGSPLPLKTFDDFDVGYYPDENLPDFGTTVRRHMGTVLQCCKNFAQNLEKSDGNLLLIGPAGLGKTHLALSVANAAIGKSLGVIYDTCQNIFSKMEDEQFGRSKKKYTPLLLECDLLVMDDLGAEFASPFNVTALYNVINTRLLSRRSTVISTNLRAGDIAQRYNDRIYSRLIGEYSILRFFGRDIRLLKLKDGEPQ